MIFGSDLDGVIFDIFPIIFEKLKIISGKNIDIDGAFNMENSYQLSRKIVSDAINEIIFAGNYPLIKNIEILYEISRLTKNTIHFISSRPDNAYLITDQELLSIFNKHELRYTLSFTSGLSKVNKIKELDVDFFVEDCPHQTKSNSEETDCVTFLLNKSYNKNVQENKKIIRVNNWLEIYKHLKKEN